MSTPIRTVECKYNGCGKLFTSKPRMKEHVLWHLETDPPERIHQHAIVQYRPDGSWTVIRDLSPPRAEGSGGEAGPSQVDSEIEKFRITDILPTDSQLANTTMTTSTSGGTTSQPITFSPVLPDRPSQISLPPHGQSPLRPFNSLPNSTQSQPSSLPKSLVSRTTSREPIPLPSPFVHSAPTRANGSASPSPTIARKRLQGNSTSPTKRRTRLSASPFVPETQAKSSSSRSRSTISHSALVVPSQSQGLSDSSQFPPASGSSEAHTEAGTSSRDAVAGAGGGGGTPGKEVKRTFGFGEALGLLEKIATPDTTRSGVTFGFGTR